MIRMEAILHPPVSNAAKISLTCDAIFLIRKIRRYLVMPNASGCELASSLLNLTMG